MTILGSVVIADPAWSFGDDLPGETRGSAKQYKTAKQQVNEIVEMIDAVPMLFDARLCLWRVAAMQEDAIRVGRRLGYTLKAEIVWVKCTKNGLLHVGMGHQVRNSHEVCLIFTRGRPEERRSAGVRSVIFDDSVAFSAATPIHCVEACGVDLATCPDRDRHRNGGVIHSAKPDAFYSLIEELYVGPYYELNARRRRPGWLQSGDELPPEVTP